MIRPKTTRSRRYRLAQLEEVVHEAFDDIPTGPITAFEWLEIYREWASDGFFSKEPDFEATMEEFGRLLDNIPAERHEPTEDFEPDKPDRERLRLWHIRHEIIDLREIKSQLRAMSRRASLGLEGVSGAEFGQKKAWFKENVWDLPMHFMVAEDGTTEPRNNTIETVLYQGPTSSYALNAMLAMREWEKGNFDKSTTSGEWRRKRQLQGY